MEPTSPTPRPRARLRAAAAASAARLPSASPTSTPGPATARLCAGAPSRRRSAWRARGARARGSRARGGVRAEEEDRRHASGLRRRRGASRRPPIASLPPFRRRRLSSRARGVAARSAPAFSGASGLETARAACLAPDAPRHRARGGAPGGDSRRGSTDSARRGGRRPRGRLALALALALALSCSACLIPNRSLPKALSCFRSRAPRAARRVRLGRHGALARAVLPAGVRGGGGRRLHRGRSPPPKACRLGPISLMAQLTERGRSTGVAWSSPAGRARSTANPEGVVDRSAFSPSRRELALAGVFCARRAPPSAASCARAPPARAAASVLARHRQTDLGRTDRIGAEASTPTPTRLRPESIDESIRVDRLAFGEASRRAAPPSRRRLRARWRSAPNPWAPGPRPARTSCSAHRRAA